MGHVGRKELSLEVLEDGVLEYGWLQTTVNIVSVSEQSGLRTKVSVLELTMHPLPWPSPLTSRALSAPSLGRKWPGLHEITRRNE